MLDHHTPFLSADLPMFLRFLSEPHATGIRARPVAGKAQGLPHTRHLQACGVPLADSQSGGALVPCGYCQNHDGQERPGYASTPVCNSALSTAAVSTSIATQGRSLPCWSVPALRQNTAFSHMWMMSAAGTRFDNFQEGQIRDCLPFPDRGTNAFELTFSGTQTDTTLEGQPTVAPALTSIGSGTGV